MYVYFLIMLFYALIMGRKRTMVSLIQFMVIWSFYVYLSTFSKAFAGVLFEDFLGVQLNNALVQGTILVFTLIIFSGIVYGMKRWSLIGLGRVSLTGVAFIFFVFILSSGAKMVVDTFVDNTNALTISQLSSRLLILFTGVMLYVFIAIAYYYCYQSTKGQRENEKLTADVHRVLRESNQMEDQKKIIQENMEEMRAIRHDLKNQMAYMQIMLAQKDYGRLEQYLSQYNKEINATMQYPDCGNPVIRNLLGLEAQKAKNEGISIDARVAMDTTRIEDTDLTALLMNLLDNAIEACTEDRIRDAVISCVVRQNEQYLFITVSNPVTDASKAARRKKLITAKDATIHGRGTRIVNRIAEKYNGAVDYRLEKGTFTASVMLSIAERN